MTEPKTTKPQTPPTAEKPRYHHGDLRAALVAAGHALLQEKGLAGLSLRACAARAGVSHAAPKNHFPRLENLLTALCADGFRRHAAVMRAAMAQTASERTAQAEAAGAAYVAFAAANPALFRLMFSAERVDWADPELSAAGDASFAVLREISDLGDGDGAADPARRGAREAARWAQVHGLAHLAIDGKLARIAQDAGRAPTVVEVMRAAADFFAAPRRDR